MSTRLVPRPLALSLASTLALVSTAACGRSQPVNLGGHYVALVDVAPQPVHDIDLLFVIDDSAKGPDTENALAVHAQEALFQAIALGLGERPNLHVAAVSSSMGIGPYTIPGCLGSGDDGRFLDGRGCASTVQGHFISDVAGDNGERVTNFTGNFADEFACLVDLGTRGCGFERPFDAMKRALDGTHPENEGFLRPSALLVVVILTDEDDCSARTELYDVNDTSLTGTLGPLESFRCFEFGVTCDESDAPRAAGTRTNCHASDDSPYMTPVAIYADFLASLKSDPTQVMVVGISGSGTLTTVGISSDKPVLYPACPLCNGAPCPLVYPTNAPPPIDAGLNDPPFVADAGPEFITAAPSFRVPALVDAFPARSLWSNFCDGGTESALKRTAAAVVNVAARRACLGREPHDVDPDTAGIQTDCRGYQVTGPRTDSEKRTEVPTCAASGGAEPCFEVVDDSNCASSGPSLRAKLHGASAEGTHFVVDCLVD